MGIYQDADLRSKVEVGELQLRGLYKGLRAWVWDIKLERFKLVPCTHYFSIVKKKTGSRPVDVGILPNHINTIVFFLYAFIYLNIFLLSY